MKLLNRSVAIVRYREPYLRWAAGTDRDAPRHAKGLASHVSVYLLPPDPLEEQESAPLIDHFVALFDHELETWCTDPRLWPGRRDFATFSAWFDVTVDSIVLDLDPRPLRSEEF